MRYKIFIALFCILSLVGLTWGIPGAQAQQDIDVTPSTLNFGPVTVGTTSTLPVTISNLGNADLSITDLVITGSGDFTLAAGTPSPPFTLAPNTSIEVSIDYTPSVAQTVNGVLWIGSNDPDEGLRSVSLTGTGLGVPDIEVTPLALDFGDVALGDTVTLTATISNAGSEVLTVSGLAISGSADFALGAGAPTPPFTVFPGLSVDVPVAYTPSAQGADTGTLDISSDDPNTPLIQVSLSGNGIQPPPACGLDVTPLQLAFGTVTVGTTATLSTTITNVGNLDCNITGLTTSGSADFALGAGAPAPPFVLSPGASVAVPVDYSPGDSGADSGTLDISSDAPGQPTISVVLSGTGTTVPDITVSPTSLAFGTVTVGTTATLNTTISNVGNGDLTITEFAFTGSQDFALNPSAPGLPLVVAPGGSVDIPIDYTPSVAKAVNGVLWIASDDPDESVVPVQLSGTGIACDLLVNPLALDFGLTEIGQTQTLTTTLTNLGSADCHISALTLGGSADFHLNPATPVPPFVVAPGGTAEVSVDYSPSDFVDDTGTLEIDSDDPDQPVITVDLSGTPPANACDIEVSPLALDFGQVNKLSTKTLTVTIRNRGSVDCSVDFTLGGSADFAFNPATPTPPLTLAFGTSVDVAIDYTPADVGVDSGTLDISSNDPDTPSVSVSLSGEGLGIPDIDVSPTSLAFGAVRLGTTVTLSTTIQNLGETDLTVTDLALTGSPDFALGAGAPSVPFVIVSGGSVDVPVAYTPSVRGAVNAVLWIASDDPDEDVVPVQLSGTGRGDPDIAVSPQVLDFNSVTVGMSSTLTTTISNVGTENLTVTGLSLSGTDFSLSGAPSTPFTVAAGASVNVSIVYAPTNGGPDSGTLTITSDDPDEPTVPVTLTGTGVLPPNECDITVSPLVLDYKSVDVGTTQTLSTTIGNVGSVDCTISGLTISGSGEFTLNPTTPSLPFTVAFGASVNVLVDYSPVDFGGDSGTLVITSNDPDEGTVSVALSGSGVPVGTAGFIDPPHSNLPIVPGQDVCYSCHVNRTKPEQKAVSTQICLQCHGENPVPDPNLVPLPVSATPVNIHASSVTGSTRFQYTVECTNCHNPHKNSNTQGWQQIKYVKDFLYLPSLEVTDFTQNPPQTIIKEIASYVRFTDTSEFVYFDPDPYIRGICNVCHTQTNHHRNDTLAPVAPGDLDANGNYVGHNNGTDCTGCHTHINGFSPAGLTPDSAHSAQAFIDNCNYCHVDDGAGNIDYAATIPDSKCEQCHTPNGALKSSFPTAPDVVTHSAANGSGKYAYNFGCVDCHNPMADQTNLKGIRSTIAGSVIPGSNIVFTAFSGPGSFADGAPFNENVCETCHTQTNHHRYDGSAPADNPGGVYVGHNDGADCTTCHAHSNGFLPELTPPPPPHDGFSCDVCHTVDANGNLVDAVPNAPIANDKCNACHAPNTPGSGSGGSDIKVDTHFSDTYIDPDTGQLVSLNCVECHNPMREQINFRGNTNLKFIRTTIRGHQVAFEALTGPYSFAYDLADQPADMTTANYVCNTCHTQTNHHQNDGTAPGGQTHNDGADCTTCHTHDSGFRPGLGGPHPQAVTDCSNCHLNRQTQEPDLQGIHNNDCQLCHVNGFGSTILGPIGTWNGECSACHNPNVTETGNLETPTKGHRCIVCHGQQQTISNVTDMHRNHTDRANCVVCHGFIPDVGTEIGSGNRQICHLCHGTSYDNTSITELHKKMVPKGTSCLECHGDERPPVDVVAGPPVGNADVVCDVCHTNKNPSEFQNDMDGLHKKHVGKSLDCGFCHADANLQDDREPMPDLDDSRRAMVDRVGYNECAFCHGGGKSASATTVHQKHVSKMWQWCYNCHEGDDQRPIGLVPPVTQPSEACVMCHNNRSYNDTFPFDIHKKHQKKAKVKCYACHQTTPQFFDWPEVWMTP